MLDVFNDWHIGVQRGAGTTPETQWALRQYLIAKGASLLGDNDTLINGDLFDQGNIPIHDVLQTFNVFADWLVLYPSRMLWLAAGNHDLNKTSNVLSSFQFLARLLRRAFPSRVVVIEEPTMMDYGYVIPHLANQALFDHALTQVPNCSHLFLHCNYDNNFAVEADQSLNLSPMQAGASSAERIIIAHEHYPRKSGKVLIPGNQFASSVSDWQQDGDKFFIRIGRDGTLEMVRSAIKADDYTEMPYDKLELSEHKFVKVTGRVSAIDSGAIVAQLNRFRAKHQAFVLTNSVDTVSEDNSVIIAQSVEAIQSFNVWKALEEIFTKQEFVILQEVHQKA